MANTFTNLLYHVIFSTKNREPLISPDLKPRLYEYLGGIVRSEGGILIDIGGIPDHIHLLFKGKSDGTIADVLRNLKSNSSKWVNALSETQIHFSWQTGYAAFSVSESRLGAVRHYIQTQEEHHRRKTFQEEYIEFLQKHRIEYEEQYLWG